CCVCFYRSGMFIHELAHQRERFLVFRIVWNALCGIPFLIPSFTYASHLDHHQRKKYGTANDGEYLPLGHHSRWHIVWYLAQMPLIPPLIWLRFAVLAPLSWCLPPLRRWVLTRASSLVINAGYRRSLPPRSARPAIVLQEACCCAWAWLIVLYPPLV